jgi:hypothetical protein
VRDQWRFNHWFIILETLLFKSRLRYTIKESEFSVVVVVIAWWLDLQSVPITTDNTTFC